MSSNQSKRVSSITKNLTKGLRKRKKRMLFWSNLLAVIVCLVVYALTMEYATCGTLTKGNIRSLVHDPESYDTLTEEREEGYRQIESTMNGKQNRNDAEKVVIRGAAIAVYYWENLRTVDELIWYQSIASVEKVLENGEIAIVHEVTFQLPMLVEILIGVLAFIALQLVEGIFCRISSISESVKIRRLLKPIDEITLRADELTRLQFDDTKYHHLEEKITSLNPEDSLTVTQGDRELEGLETAINNLLMRMRESNMQQARFVNDASHELRTPIAVIEGYANMLARWGREDEKVLDESIAAIQHESSHMKYLVEQLLFLARGDSGRTVLKFEDVSLNVLMREIYEESLMIDEKHVYKFRAPEEELKISCDPALLKQAVRILVDNASKYTKEKDEITISVGKNTQGRPYLQVDDTGIGMAESDVEHMFERFYRSDEVRSYKGTGLGLSIAKWIVDKHNGHFEVTSRIGIGTRMRIVL